MTGIVYNPTGLISIVTQVAGVPGNLLNEVGMLADARRGLGAHYMATETFAVDTSALVCTGGTLYDSDAPFGGGQAQYLGVDGGFTTDNTLYELAQFVGRATDTRTMWFSLLDVDPAIQELRQVVDFLLAAINGPSLTELQDEIRRYGAIR